MWAVGVGPSCNALGELLHDWKSHAFKVAPLVPWFVSVGGVLLLGSISKIIALTERIWLQLKSVGRKPWRLEFSVYLQTSYRLKNNFMPWCSSEREMQLPLKPRDRFHTGFVGSILTWRYYNKGSKWFSPWSPLSLALVMRLDKRVISPSWSSTDPSRWTPLSSPPEPSVLWCFLYQRKSSQESSD